MAIRIKKSARPRGKAAAVSNDIVAELDVAATATSKQQFAQKFSTALALKVANALRPDFREIRPHADGSKQESLARTSKGFKRLDVNYSTVRLGLALGVSIKTTNAPEGTRASYAKNVSGRDAELRAEAEDYHERQPYAVLVALYFVPIESCDNSTDRAPSSFGNFAKTLRFRAGRKGPKDLTTLFERAFIGLYVANGPKRGHVEFFDVARDPPRSGRPRGTLSFSEMITQIKDEYDKRNVTFRFSDAPEPETTPSEDQSESDDESAPA